MATKNITLLVGGKELPFEMTTADYNRYINEVTPDSKVTPSINLLRRTLQNKPENKEFLDELIDRGIHVELAANLVNDFRGEIEIEVKK